VPTFCQGIAGLDTKSIDSRDSSQVIAVVPTPLKEVCPHLHLLTPEGEAVVRRLLWCTQLTCQVEFSPFLPNLFVVLLAFFNEDETFYIVNQIIQEVDSDPHPEKSQNPRLITTTKMLNKQAKLFVREGKKSGNAPEILSHLESLGLDLHSCAAELLQDGLAHVLPFRVMCRLVGSFLVEGSDIILRYGIALVKLRTAALRACTEKEQAKEILLALGKEMSNSPEAIDDLTKIAYSLNLRDTNLSRVSSGAGGSYCMPTEGIIPHIFCRPRLFEPRGNCPDAMWEALWSWVPPTCRIFDPKLIYQPTSDGTSIRTCLQHCLQSKSNRAQWETTVKDARPSDLPPMIFFIYAKGGHIIGGFSPVIWCRTSGFIKLVELSRPAEDAFVFRRLDGGRTEVFPWSGDNQFLFQASESEGFSFGGDGTALFIQKDLTRASTDASKTFRSPALLDGATVEDAQSPPTPSGKKTAIDFEILRLEVFALV